MECVRCGCLWLGETWEERGRVDERIGFGLYQSCMNRGVLDVSLCLGCRGVGGEWIGAWTRVWRSGVIYM